MSSSSFSSTTTANQEVISINDDVKTTFEKTYFRKESANYLSNKCISKWTCLLCEKEFTGGVQKLINHIIKYNFFANERVKACDKSSVNDIAAAKKRAELVSKRKTKNPDENTNSTNRHFNTSSAVIQSDGDMLPLLNKSLHENYTNTICQYDNCDLNNSHPMEKNNLLDRYPPSHPRAFSNIEIGDMPVQNNDAKIGEQHVQLNNSPYNERKMFSEFGLCDDESVQTILNVHESFESMKYPVAHVDYTKNFNPNTPVDEKATLLLNYQSDETLDDDEENNGDNNVLNIKDKNYKHQNLAYNPELESRLKYIRRMLTKFPHGVNSGDMQLIKDIITGIFTPNCKFQFLFMNQEETGRDKLIFYLEQRLKSVPDVIITMSPFILHNSHVLFARQRSWGTQVPVPPALSTINPSSTASQTTDSSTATTASESFPYFDNRTNDPDYDRERQKATKIMGKQKLVAFQSQCLIYFVLNRELTFVERFVIERKNIKVSEYKDVCAIKSDY